MSVLPTSMHGFSTIFFSSVCFHFRQGELSLWDSSAVGCPAMECQYWVHLWIVLHVEHGILFTYSSTKFDIWEIHLSGWNVFPGSKVDNISKLNLVRFSHFKLVLHRNHSRNKKGNELIIVSSSS